MPDLSRKRERDRLATRPDPYWQRLSEGAYLGFLRGPQTWRARYRGRDKKQQFKALGGDMEFDEAKRLAEDWFEQIGSPATRKVKRDSVQAALEAYLADLRRHGRHAAAEDAERRYRTTVYEDALATTSLETATHDDFLEWRDRLIPGREPRTINRYARALTAALNRAYRLGHLGNPVAWKFTALADDVEDEGDTAVFLSPAQRSALIAAARPSTAEFLRALEFTGARPSEMASAKVSDFDGQRLKLSHHKGRPPKLRSRLSTLSAAAIVFFEEHTKGKFPAAPIFTEDGNQRWRRHSWAKDIRAAITAHNEKARGSERLPAEVGAYAFRHARISELLQVHGVDPLTVAHQTGTSLAMIEKAYFRFIPDAMSEKLEKRKTA